MIVRWKYIFILFSSLFFGLNLHAQTEIDFDDCYDCGNTDEIPRFTGNNADFHAYIKENIKIPVRTDCTEGSVYIQITIDTSGFVKNPVIKKSICKAFDEGALRLISLMPKWIPGTQNGKKVDFKMIVPIPFKSEFYKK